MSMLLQREEQKLTLPDPGALARVVVRLKTFTLTDIYAYLHVAKPTSHQIETMFAVLDKEKNTELQTLGLVGVNLIINNGP